MLGRSHIVCGMIVGVGFAAALPAPIPVRLFAIPVCGGAALLPDLDHPQATVARSLGFVTRWASEVINAVALHVYDSTATNLDPDRRNGHRLLTHTIPGAVAFGVLDLLLAVAGPRAVVAAAGPPWAVGLPVAVSLGFLIGLCGAQWIGRGFLPALVTTGVAWWVTTAYPGWWWVWPVVVGVGALAGVAGDACTPSGVPICWPFVVAGQRWYMVTTPATFRTGKHIEKVAITPLLWVTLGVESGFVTGLIPAVVRVVAGG